MRCKAGYKQVGNRCLDNRAAKTWHETEVGRRRYVITFYDGVNRHDDGSLFGDIRIFHNKVKRDAFTSELTKKGYVYKSPYEVVYT